MRKAQLAHGAIHVAKVARHHISRELNARGVARHLHGFARGIVKRRSRTGKGDVHPLQRLNHFDARRVLIPRAVAEVDRHVEALAGDLDHLLHRRGFKDLEVGAIPVRKVDRRIAGRVEFAKGRTRTFVRWMQNRNFHGLRGNLAPIRTILEGTCSEVKTPGAER